jgi:uroporphyrinogen-III synthase
MVRAADRMRSLNGRRGACNHAGMATRRPPRPLAGRRVVLTRPVGSGAALARRVAALGGDPLVLPTAALRATGRAARTALVRAQSADVLLFTSPAAVRFARRLAPLAPAARARVLAPGAATARSLARAGIEAETPELRSDSEGLLALPALRAVRGRRVAIIGAPGGRGLLDAELGARGARVERVHVYERALPRWQSRHHAQAARIDARTLVLVSSAESLENLRVLVGDAAWRNALRATLVASSARIAALARRRGFARVVRARSALAEELLAATLAAVC